MAIGLGTTGIAHADADRPETFYGFMNNAASWSADYNFDPYWGVYTFSADGSTGFRAVSPIGYDYDWAVVTNGGGAAVYDDGYFYCFTSYARGPIIPLNTARLTPIPGRLRKPHPRVAPQARICMCLSTLPPTP